MRRLIALITMMLSISHGVSAWEIESRPIRDDHPGLSQAAEEACRLDTFSERMNKTENLIKGNEKALRDEADQWILKFNTFAKSKEAQLLSIYADDMLDRGDFAYTTQQCRILMPLYSVAMTALNADVRPGDVDLGWLAGSNCGQRLCISQGLRNPVARCDRTTFVDRHRLCSRQ